MVLEKLNEMYTLRLKYFGDGGNTINKDEEMDVFFSICIGLIGVQ
jgi:hypothetical protein